MLTESSTSYVDVIGKIVPSFFLSRTPQLICSDDIGAYIFMRIAMDIVVDIYRELQSFDTAKKLSDEVASELFA